MNEALAAEKFRATGLKKKLFCHIAASYGGKAFALHFEEGLAPADVRELADAIAQTCGVATVFSGSDDAGYSLCIVSHREDVRPLGKEAAAALDGRGGGKPEAFQGSFKATRQRIEKFFANHL